MTEMDYRAEATEAKELVETLLERVREGDEAITPDEIENARRLAEFAELRGEAAERKAWSAARDVAAAEQEAAAAALRELLAETTADLTAAEKKAAKAFEALMDAVDQRYAAAFRAARRLRLANKQATEYDLPSSLDAHGVGYDVGSDRFRVVNERGAQRAVSFDHLKDPEHWLRAVVEPARIRFGRSIDVTSARHPERLLEESATPGE